MKRKQKGLLGFWLACMMICLPVSQSLAAVSYDASVAVSNQVLFPGDSLINVAEELPVLIDGQAAASDTPGTWTNGSTDKVYTATTAEDGTSIQIATAGYVLVVERGESKKNDDGADNSWNHYSFSEDEKPEVPQDMAFYAAGETVKLKASEPEEGMVFAGWKTSDESVTVADPSSAETTLVMPEKKVTVTALYEEAQAETTSPEETADPALDPAEGTDAAGTTDPAEGTDAGEAGTAAAAEGTDAAGTMEPAEGTDAVETTNPAEGADAAGTAAPAEGTDAAGTTDPAEGADAAGTDGPAEGTDAGETGATAPAEGTDEGNQPAEVILGSGENNAQNVVSTIEDTDTADIPVEVYDEGQPETYAVFVTDGFVSEETGVGPYAVNTPVKVRANDYTADGLVFSNWLVTSGNLDIDLSTAEIEFNMPQGDVYLDAEYKPMEPEETETEESEQPESPAVNTYEVVVENGNGSGTYAVGETVTLEAGDVEGRIFSGWKTDNEAVQLADPSQASTTFVMPEASVKVTAEYTEQVQEEESLEGQDPLNNGDGSGDGTGDNANAGGSTTVAPESFALTLPAGTSVAVNDTPGTAEADGTYKIPANAVVSVTAASADGQSFTGWTAKDAGAQSVALALNGSAVNMAEATLTFNMPSSNVTLEASYEKIPAQYTIKVANGTVTGATANADGSWTVTEGTQIVVTANTAPAGEAFSGWKITDSSNADVNPGVDTAAASITLTPTQSLNFQANYTGVQYSVSVTNGSSNYSTAVSGTSVTITADAAPAGMEFNSWSVTSGNVSLANASSATTTFTMPTANVAITASYRQKTYSLTVKNGSADSDRYYMDDEPVISANYPDAGKEFDYWYAESGNVVFDEDYLWKTAFTMPASDVTVTARYKDGPSTNDNKILDIVEGGEYYTGSTIKFTASGAGMDKDGLNPGDYRYRPTGYQISNVTGNWQSAPYTTSMAIKAVGEYTLKVTFSKEVYDGKDWAADGTTDTKTVTFRVVNNTSVATGDSTPIIAVAVIAGAALLIFLVLLVVFIRRRRK